MRRQGFNPGDVMGLCDFLVSRAVGAASPGSCARLAALALPLLPAAAQGPPREEGARGTRAPQAADVVLDDRVLHDDRAGGCGQSLIGLTAATPGYAALWRDMRDGNLGIYWERLDPDGAPLGLEGPIHEARTTRQLDPSVALAPDGSGALAWVFTVGNRAEVHVRFFDAEGRLEKRHSPVEPAEEDSRGRPFLGQKPVAVALPDPSNGGIAVAWKRRDGSLRLQRFEGDDRKAAPLVVERVGIPGDAVQLMAASPSGQLLLAARRATDNVTWLVSGRDVRSPVSLADGPPLCLRADPEGGYWLLAGTLGDVLVLRHLDERGRPGEPAVELDARGLSGVDLAVGPEDVVVLTEAPSRVELSAFARGTLTRVAGPTAVLPEGAEPLPGSRLAASGRGMLVGWTDTRRGDQDVFVRTVGRASEGFALGEPRRVNTDEGSAHQNHVTLCGAGRAAFGAWQDRRVDGAAIYVREVGADGALGPELRVPVPAEGAAAQEVPSVSDARWPALAADGDGHLAVLWQERHGRGYEPVSQVLQPARPGAPPPRTLDPGHSVDPDEPPVVGALAGGSGWLALWIRDGGAGVHLRTLAASGEPLGEPAPVSDPARGPARRCALARLDDGRFIAVWDQRPGRGGTLLRGRFLDASGGLLGAELRFEGGGSGADWDPAVAPAADGGFLLAWCSGSESDRNRDVVARFFDRRGLPASPLLPLTVRLNEQDYPEVARLADGSWVVAWEDDISGFDHVYARRVLDHPDWMGPAITLNQRESPGLAARSRPVVAALGDGFLAAWGDRRRSLGWDVFVKILGPAFDDLR